MERAHRIPRRTRFFRRLTTSLAVQSYGKPRMRTITWAPFVRNVWASLLLPADTRERTIEK